MHTSFLRSVFLGLSVSFSFAAAAPVPSLLINVDTTAKEYFLSGSATGWVGGEEIMPGMGHYQIFWDNGQDNYGQAYANLFSASAFTVSGNDAYAFVMFINENGNINGAFDFASGADVTLTGNPEVRYSYGEWAPSLINEFESKALDGELVYVTDGSSAFTLAFGVAAIPEPSTFGLFAGGLALAAAVSRRSRGRRV